jgi:hypothetical protein
VFLFTAFTAYIAAVSHLILIPPGFAACTGRNANKFGLQKKIPPDVPIYWATL